MHSASSSFNGDFQSSTASSLPRRVPVRPMDPSSKDWHQGPKTEDWFNKKSRFSFKSEQTVGRPYSQNSQAKSKITDRYFLFKYFCVRMSRYCNFSVHIRRRFRSKPIFDSASASASITLE